MVLFGLVKTYSLVFPCRKRLNVDVFLKLSILVEIPVIILLVGLFKKPASVGWQLF